MTDRSLLIFVGSISLALAMAMLVAFERRLAGLEGVRDLSLDLCDSLKADETRGMCVGLLGCSLLAGRKRAACAEEVMTEYRLRPGGRGR
jgi:hypothetical protein